MLFSIEREPGVRPPVPTGTCGHEAILPCEAAGKVPAGNCRPSREAKLKLPVLGGEGRGQRRYGQRK